MQVSIVQPYFLPYIGYFQLINAVDIFIFYDDVNFINRGWINRNNFLINGNKQLITLSCEKASQNKLINEIELKLDDKIISKILKSIQFSYIKSPYFSEIFELVEKILRYTNMNLAQFAANSVKEICNYLDLQVSFKFSSEEFGETKGMEKADRLIEITKKVGANNYINPIGGQEIYNKSYFAKNEVSLYFLKTNEIIYKQFKNDFVAWLSVVDVLMFNSKEKTKLILKDYELV